MQNTKNILRKIRLSYEVSTNAELAQKLGLTVSAIEAWSRRKSIPERYLFKCVGETGVALDWLLDEDKPIFHISGGSKHIFQVNNSTISSEANEELELFEEFEKIETLAKMSKKMDFLKEELIKHL